MGGRGDCVLSPCDGDRTVERGGGYDRWSVSVKYDRWGKLGVCVYGEEGFILSFFGRGCRVSRDTRRSHVPPASLNLTVRLFHH